MFAEALVVGGIADVIGVATDFDFGTGGGFGDDSGGFFEEGLAAGGDGGTAGFEVDDAEVEGADEVFGFELGS